MRALAVLALMGIGFTVPAALAQDAPLVPERRLILTENSDLPGGDITSIFDTTLEACEAACLNDPSCQAFTFNTRSNSCFPKSSESSTTWAT